MSLATRCPACGTVFRVVQDQLKVSQGWVRCGRCSEVFSALESLFDLEPEGAAAAPEPQAGRVIDELARHAGPPLPQPGDWQAEDEAPSPLSPPPSPPASAPAPWPEPPRAAPQPFIVSGRAMAPGVGSARPTPPRSADPVEPADDEPAAPAGPSAAIADAAPTVSDEAPTFVRQAEKAERWQRPGMRAALALAALLLAVLLGAQLALGARDLLAARWPASTPALQALCNLTGCRIEPLRRINLLSVDASGLTRVEGAPLYRLSVVLRNRGDTALRLPALDLSLTDTQGQLVSRRVLQPVELGAAGASIPAGQELPLQALLSAGERRLAGYTVEIFYP